MSGAPSTNYKLSKPNFSWGLEHNSFLLSQVFTLHIIWEIPKSSLQKMFRHFLIDWMKILKTAIYSCWFYGYEMVDISLKKLRFVILSKRAAQQLCLVSVEDWILASLHTLSHQGGMDSIPMHAAHKGKTSVSNHGVMSETFPPKVKYASSKSVKKHKAPFCQHKRPRGSLQFPSDSSWGLPQQKKGLWASLSTSTSAPSSFQPRFRFCTKAHAPANLVSRAFH